MNRAAELSLVVLLGSASLFAQSSAKNNTQAVVAHVPPASIHCPIDMRARFDVAGSARKVDSDRHREPGQQLHITVRNLKSSQIVQAKLTVHGFTKGHVSPAQFSNADTSETTKTVDLVLKVDGNDSASTDLWLDSFTSIDLIDVNSVRYANGSTWRSSAGKACHIVPDGTMLISTR